MKQTTMCSIQTASQRVVFPGNSLKRVLHGALDFVPSSFFAYINDIVYDIYCTIRLIANENPIEAAQLKNANLEQIHQWARQKVV